jgi:hypothetical protein
MVSVDAVSDPVTATFPAPNTLLTLSQELPLALEIASHARLEIAGSAEAVDEKTAFTPVTAVTSRGLLTTGAQPVAGHVTVSSAAVLD